MPPTFTNSQIIAQIDSGYHWMDGASTATTITYGITTSANWFPSNYGEGPGWSGLNAKQIASANLSFELWDDIIAPDLDPALDPNSADMRISNTTTDIGYAHAYYPGEVGNDAGS